MTKEFKKTLFDELSRTREVFSTKEEESVAKSYKFKQSKSIHNEDKLAAHFDGLARGFRFAKEFIELEIKYLERLSFLEDSEKND